MKTDLSPQTPKQENKPIYPYLGQFRDSFGSFIVFFTEERTGVVIHTERNTTLLGTFERQWCEGQFIKYEGEVRLEND